MNEIRIGGATYVIERSFTKGNTVSELIIGQLLANDKADTAFDEHEEKAV